MRNLGSRLINGFLLTALLLAKVTCAQNLELQSGQPVIHGEINGMKVMAQGDYVAFIAAGKPLPLLSEKECDRDLHCTMQKNRTGMLVLSSKQLLIYDRPLNPLEELPDNATHTDPLYPDAAEIIRYSNIPINPATATIALDFPQPTITIPTGNEVVDETPGVLWVSSQIMTWLAEAVTTFSNTRQMLATSSGDMLTPIIEPSSTQQQRPLPSLTEEENELLKSLMSTTTMPMPSPTPVLVEDGLGMDGSVRVITELDHLMIRPSPSGQYGGSSETTSSFSHTVKQVPTETGSRAESTISENTEVTSTATDSVTAESLQASNLPTNTQRASEGGGAATGVTKIDQKVVEMTASEAQASASSWRLLVPSPLDLLVAAKTPADLSIEQKRKILSYVRGFGKNALDEEYYPDEEIEETFDSSTKRGRGIMLGFWYLYDCELDEDVNFDGGWCNPNFDGALSLQTPGYLSPDYFQRLLAKNPSQDQVEEKSIRPVLAKEPLIRPTGLPETEHATLKDVVLHRIQQKFNAKKLEDPNNPGHLPPLSVREIRNLITRCALPEKELVKLVGVSQIVGGDPIDNSIISGRDGLLKALLQRLRSGEGADQSLFDKGGTLEHWRYIPEYNADEKRALLVKKMLTWSSWHYMKKTELMDSEEIAEVIRVFKELSDNDIHYRYGDCYIHRLAEQFFGRIEAKRSLFIPEYSAERKRAIVARHCELCHETEVKPCSEDPPCQLFDDDDQMHQRYSDADIRMMEIRVYDKQQDQ